MKSFSQSLSEKRNKLRRADIQGSESPPDSRDSRLLAAVFTRIRLPPETRPNAGASIHGGRITLPPNTVFRTRVILRQSSRLEFDIEKNSSRRASRFRIELACDGETRELFNSSGREDAHVSFDLSGFANKLAALSVIHERARDWEIIT